MILDKITKATRIRVEKAKLTHPLKELIDRIESCDYMEGKKAILGDSLLPLRLS